MAIFYQYFSLMNSNPQKPNGSTAVGWVSSTMMYSLVPARSKLKELAATCIRKNDMISNSLLFAAQQELVWWIETNITEHEDSGKLVMPALDWKSLSSSTAWKRYWKELKQRVVPSVLRYQATLSLMVLFQGFLSAFVSKETLYRLTQHPPRRALIVSSRESDRLAVGMELWISCLWANLLFFAASYTVAQIGLCYKLDRKRKMLRIHGSPNDDQTDFGNLVTSSWKLISTRCRRYFYSSLGGGLGSIFWPGWGTLYGIGFGDGWAEMQPEPEPPASLFSFLFRIIKCSSSAVGDDMSSSLPYAGDHDELGCGCCQIASFSSNPNSLDRAPISSRACDHTICKSCVHHCHLAVMERTCNYEEWIKCPLCNAERAFSSHNHLVNRSLCAAIATIEQGTHL